MEYTINGTNNINPNNNKRWSNPVIDRLTGGTGGGSAPNSAYQYNMNQKSQTQTLPSSLRNESYYMATNDNWSPSVNLNNTSSVLIEEDPEPQSPYVT